MVNTISTVEDRYLRSTGGFSPRSCGFRSGVSSSFRSMISSTSSNVPMAKRGRRVTESWLASISQANKKIQYVHWSFSSRKDRSMVERALSRLSRHSETSTSFRQRSVPGRVRLACLDVSLSRPVSVGIAKIKDRLGKVLQAPAPWSHDSCMSFHVH